MRNHWAEDFFTLAQLNGANCQRINYSNGWLETATIDGRRCFTKSMTYNLSKNVYFQGVDPGKLQHRGDAVVLCGGVQAKFQDVFVIPWDAFFSKLAQGQPVNTYRDREYFQYKFHIRNDKLAWIISFQGGNRPTLDVTRWHHSPLDAIQAIRTLGKR